MSLLRGEGVVLVGGVVRARRGKGDAGGMVETQLGALPRMLTPDTETNAGVLAVHETT